MPSNGEADERAATTVSGNGSATGGGRADGGGMALGMPGGRAGFSLRDLRTFSSFRNPVFRLYYGAMLAQMAAMNMQMMARSFLVYHLTGSLAILGAMGLANALPMLFLSLYGGVIADRAQKKYILMAGQAGSAVISLAIALTLTFGLLSVERAGSWWILVAASLAQGTIMGLMMPSRQAMIADIVGEENLMNAVALNTLGMNLLRLVAPAVAGFAIEFFGYQSVYYAMTGLYLLAVVIIARMPLTGTMTLRGRGSLQDMIEGLRYIRSNTVIFLILGLILFMVMLSMPYMMLLPAFKDILNVGESGIGVLISVSGIGALTGSLVLASLPNKKRGALMLVSSLVLGVALVGFAFSQIWYVSLAFIVFVGLGQSGRMTLGSTLLMYYVAPEYRGRVMSVYMMEFGLTSFSVLFAGLAAEAVGVDRSIGGLAILLVIMSILALAFVPKIRRLD